MQAIKRYLLCILIVTSIGIFNSCSSDDSESSSIKSSLVGAWKTSMGWKTIKINPNGSMKYDYLTKEQLKKYNYNKETGMYWYRWTDNDGCGYGIEYDPSDNAHWAFDETTQTISMYRDDGYYSYTYKVTMNDDKKSWVGIDISTNRTYTFTRIDE